MVRGVAPVIGPYPLDRVVGRLLARIGNDQQFHAALVLDVPKRGPLLVEEVGRHLHRERRDDPSGVLLHRLAGEQPEHRHCERFGVANVAAAVAARTDLVAGLAEGGPQPLPRHLEQPEARDLSELNPGSIHLQGIAQALLHLTLVADRGHVDEVDHDESADVAEPELSGDLVRRLQVGLECGLLDVRAAGGPCRVDVDGHQRFGMVDDDGAAGREAHGVVEGSFDPALDLVPTEQRHPVLVELQAAHAGRHDQAHELARLLEHLRGIDQDLLGVLAEVVPQRADDDVAFLVDEEGGGALLGCAPDRLPHLEEIVDVPLKLFGGAADPGRAHDEADSVRDVESSQGFAKLCPLVAFHPARDPARSRVVRHEDEVTAREADEGGERRALVAALLLLDLDDDLLARRDRLLHREAAILSVSLVAEKLAGDLLEREESVASRPVVHEGGVEAGLDTDDPALVDVGLFLDPRRRLDVHVEEVLPVDERNTKLFRLLRVDQHSFHEKAFTQCRRSSEH